MKITMDGKYQTRDGRKVRLLCVDGPDESSPVIGLVEGETTVDGWTKEGLWYPDGFCEEWDLVLAPEQYRIWVVVGRKPSGFVYTKCSQDIRDVWTLDEGDVILARKLVEIQKGEYYDEVHSS